MAGGPYQTTEPEHPYFKPRPNNDPLDYSDQYNTPLSKDEQSKYDKAFPDPHAKYDYDMQGYWKENQTESATHQGHYPDKYKKPNHPTFSDESIYNDDFHKGGHWIDDQHFTPGDTNLKLHDFGGLQKYFDKNEPNAHLRYTHPQIEQLLKGGEEDKQKLDIMKEKLQDQIRQKRQERHDMILHRPGKEPTSELETNTKVAGIEGQDN